MELSAVLQCIRKLLSPPRERVSFLHSLEESLEMYKVYVNEKILKSEVEPAISGLEIQHSDSFTGEVAVYCKFTEQGLALTCLLDNALRQAHSQDILSVQESKKTRDNVPSCAKEPRAPNALLSAAEEKSVHTLLQFLVALGLYPFLLPGVDHILTTQLGQMARQIKKNPADLHTNSTILYIHCRPLLRLLSTPVIGPSVVSHHLTSILASLLQVCHTFKKPLPSRDGGKSTVPSSEGERKGSILTVVDTERCKKDLVGLLDRFNKPLLVRELLRLQGTQRNTREEGGAPKWLPRDCGKLLSSLLMKDDGVLSVLLGILDATSGDDGVKSGSHGNWKQVQAVAQIVSHCPAQASSPSHYYSIIAPQLLKLLTLPGVVSTQVTVTTISLMLKQQPGLCRSHLIHPLTLPLRLAASGGELGERKLPDAGGPVRDIETAILNLHKMCGCVEPSSILLRELQPFLPILFHVWQASKHSKTNSQKLKSEMELVLVAVLNSLDSEGIIHFLRYLAGIPPAVGDGPVEWIAVSPDVIIEVLSEGGGVRVGKRGKGGEEVAWSSERMEREGRDILDLLGAVLKSKPLISQFFMECFICVSAIICLDSQFQPQSQRVKREMKAWSSIGNYSNQSKLSSASSALLDIERGSQELGRTESYHRSLVLYLTAAMSEENNDDIITNTDTRTLLDVVGVVIECHAHIMTRKSEKWSPLNLLVVQPDLDSVLGGPITLSIAFGYLSAILTGANEMEKSNRALLSSLLRPLEVISGGYPDPELAGLADDLRICISTLGAVWSEEMKEWGDGKRGGASNRVLSELERKEIAPGVSRVRSKDGEEKKERKSLIKEIHQPLPLSNLSSKIKQNESKFQKPPSHSKKPQFPVEKDSSSKFQLAMAETRESEIPIKGHGLSSLAKLIESSDQETLSHSDQLIEIFRESLSHSDSYIYLPAIRGLVALGSRQPERVLPILCQEYAMFSETRSQKKAGVDSETGVMNTETYERGSAGGGMERMEKRKEVSLELRLKLGEALVRVSRECGELLPHYSDRIMPAVLCNVTDPHPLIRASSLSNLADICRLLGHSFTKYHHEVLSCVTNLLMTDNTPQVQQSALLVITLLLKGLSRQSVEVLGESLRDVYQLLKRVEGDGERDELIRDHARSALTELDHIMRDLIFTKPSLTKHITIL